MQLVTGNVGIYSTNGGNATNYGTITVGATDQSTERYAIGMLQDLMVMRQHQHLQEKL